ncbi:MAG: hypothetical protein IJ740_18630 [Ruminococcus sp.]|nr:hypothetical protein [Ruminococcus sp.]
MTNREKLIKTGVYDLMEIRKMREILFRAKDEASNKWVYGYYVHLPSAAGSVHIMQVPAGNPDENNTAYYIIPETVGEYTGLTDRNGKKIFEGDILRSFLGKKKIISVVKYGAFRPDFFYECSEKMGYSISKKIYGLFAKDNNGEEMMFAEDIHLAEIIGNIHDNPKLVEG